MLQNKVEEQLEQYQAYTTLTNTKKIEAEVESLEMSEVGSLSLKWQTALYYTFR